MKLHKMGKVCCSVLLLALSWGSLLAADELGDLPDLTLPEDLQDDFMEESPQILPFPDVHMEKNDADEAHKNPELNLEPLDEPESKPERSLSEEDLRLQTRILRVLREYERISMSAAENCPVDVMNFIVPYGVNAEIYADYRENSEKVNAIAALCWNLPMQNEVLFRGNEEQILPKSGYGIQQYSGQFLATLAIARVRSDYRFPANAQANAVESGTEAPPSVLNFTISDLVEYEQRKCRAGRNLSFTLIGLAYYMKENESWQTDDGETWNLERVVQNELERPLETDEVAGVNKLLALMFAIRCYEIHHSPQSTYPFQYQRAYTYMQKFRAFTLGIQNERGCWHPSFFENKGEAPNDPTGMLISSGHILRWLMAATAEEDLRDDKIRRAVEAELELLEAHLAVWDPSSASSREIEGVMVGLHAVKLYQKRCFKEN